MFVAVVEESASYDFRNCQPSFITCIVDVDKLHVFDFAADSFLPVELIFAVGLAVVS
jgi:hypothetical protein